MDRKLKRRLKWCCTSEKSRDPDGGRAPIRSAQMHQVGDSGEVAAKALAALLARRIMSGYYPRLARATGQRFASKGGHLVKFAEPAGTRVVDAQGRLVP